MIFCAKWKATNPIFRQGNNAPVPAMSDVIRIWPVLILMKRESPGAMGSRSLKRSAMVLRYSDRDCVGFYRIQLL